MTSLTLRSRSRSRSHTLFNDFEEGRIHITIPDTDEDEDESDQQVLNQERNLQLPQEGDTVIDLEDIAEKLEAEVYNEEPALDLGHQRLLNIDDSLLETNEHSWRNHSLRPGKTVELRDNGGFLYIRKILKSSTGIVLRGEVLGRCSQLWGLLPKTINELCFIHSIELTNQSPAKDQILVDISIDKIVKVRRLVRANKPYPYGKFDSKNVPACATKKERKKYIRDNECLVVRWALLTTFHGSADRLKNITNPNTFVCRSLRSLTENECSNDASLSPENLRVIFRGNTTLGGASLDAGRQTSRSPRKRAADAEYVCTECGEGFALPEELLEHHQRIHQEVEQDSKPASLTLQRACEGSEQYIVISDDEEEGKEIEAKESKEQVKPLLDSESVALKQYTFGDAYCGAGGTTRGAQLAGLHVKWGVDKDKHAMETWTNNFPAAEAHCCEVNEILALDEAAVAVDILHLSPPCQVFSPIHTIAGKDDDINFASLFGIHEVVKRAKSRIATLEQTFGILHHRFRHAFNSLVHMFTCLGFSVSWRIVKFQNYGLATMRKRLIIIATCPGEALPEFPPYTHSMNGTGGLRPCTTPRSLLDRIPDNAPNHEARGRGFIVPDMSWNPDNIIPAITTSGAVRYPDGTRSLTLRELATLQGFPLNHVFYGNHKARQIGNAVPPVVAKVILSWIRRHLERIDGVARQPDVIID